MFISVNDRDKAAAVQAGREASPSLGFRDRGHARHRAALQAAGLKVKIVFKVNEGRPNAVDLLKAGSLQAGDLHHHRRRIPSR